MEIREQGKENEQQKFRKKHSLTLASRSVLSVSGVGDLLAFDENGVVFDLGESTLTVTGSELCVTCLSLETGEASVSGMVDALIYTENGGKKRGDKKPLLSRIFDRQ